MATTKAAALALCLLFACATTTLAHVQDTDAPVQGLLARLFGRRSGGSSSSSYGSQQPDRAADYASSSHEYDGDAPGTCAGKVTDIWCREDRHGRLRDIVYINSVSGLHAAGCGQPNMTAPWTKSLSLGQNETIVDVKTCRAGLKRNVFASVTFITNEGNSLVCGSDGSEHDSGYGTYGKRRGYSSEEAALTSSVDGKDQDDADADEEAVEAAVKTAVEAAVDTVSTLVFGEDDGDDSEDGDGGDNEVDAAAVRAAMDDEEDEEGAHKEDANEHGSYLSRKERRRAAHEAKQRANYLKDRRSGYRAAGRELQHYKKARRHHHAHHDGSYSAAKCYHHTPRDGHSPLAAFCAKCSVDEHVSAIYGYCWNPRYDPAPANGTVVTTTVELNAVNEQGVPIPCPSTPAAVAQLNADLATISRRLATASGGIITRIAWGVYTPGQCTPAAGAAAFELDEAAPQLQPMRQLLADVAQGPAAANTTISLSGVMVPGPTYTGADVVNYLNSAATRPNEPTPDLCFVDLDSLSICEGTEFYSIPVGFSTARAMLAGMRLRVAPSDGAAGAAATAVAP